MDNLFTAGKLVKWASDALSEFKSEFFCPIYPHFISYPEIHMYSSLYIFKNPQLTFLEVAQRAGPGENPDFSCPEQSCCAVCRVLGSVAAPAAILAPSARKCRRSRLEHTQVKPSRLDDGLPPSRPGIKDSARGNQAAY